MMITEVASIHEHTRQTQRFVGDLVGCKRRVESGRGPRLIVRVIVVSIVVIIVVG